MTEPGTGTLSADLQVLVDAWTGVAVDLYGQLVAAGGRLDHSNLVVSPSSVATVLAMILPGARTATADEIAATLHTRLEPERVAAAAGALDRALLELARADELDLRISNAVWTQDGLALRLEFERALVEAFRAGLHRADFRHDPEGTRRAINQLVSQQTAGKIPELFDPGAIRSDISLVLTNAIYLEARWLQAFDPDETRPEPFNLLSRGTTEVVMLHRRGSLGYAAGDGWRAVELPYRGGRLVMDVILPDEGRCRHRSDHATGQRGDAEPPDRAARRPAVPVRGARPHDRRPAVHRPGHQPGGLNLVSDAGSRRCRPRPSRRRRTW